MKPKVLVVCHGNICRSPLAALIVARSGLEMRQGGMKKDGHPHRSPGKIRRWAAERGYDLEEHRSRAVELADAAWADVVLYMDGGNRERLLLLAPGLVARFTSLGKFIDRTRLADPNFMAEGSQEFSMAMHYVEQAAIQFTRRFA